MTKSLTRETRRSVVATPQAKLRDARRALRAAATLIRDAASMGTMHGIERRLLGENARRCEDVISNLGGVEFSINQHQASLRARRSRKAA